MAVAERKKKKTGVAVLFSLICIALIGVGVYFFVGPDFFFPSSGEELNPVFQVDGLDPAAQIGALPDSPKNESKPSGDNLFSYRINATPTFKPDGTGGNILVENPYFNEYLMVVEIEDESGELLYQSQYIAPNQHILNASLQSTPSAGTHQATAYISAVDPKTMDWVGTLECPIQLTVKE